MKPVAIGQKVRFTSAVVSRAGHDATVANMRGVVIGFTMSAVRVDTQGTFTSEEGRDIRAIPRANLEVIA